MSRFGHVTCPRCNGTGQETETDWEGPCLLCKGDGFVPDPETESDREAPASP